MMKQIEFKLLLKKAVYLIYMLMNMNVNKIHLVINVYYYSKINQNKVEEQFKNST